LIFIAGLGCYSKGMQNLLGRRAFLQRVFTSSLILGSASALGQAAAPAGLRAAGNARLLLGLAAYSFRDYFKDAAHEQAAKADRKMDMFQFLDYCADQGCLGAELTSYYFPKEVSDEYFLQVKRHAFLRGVAISGSAIGNTFTHPAGEQRDREMARARRWIDHAQLMGAPHLRVFAGSVQGTSHAEAKRLCIAALQECADYASTKGVLLGLENHGGIVAEADDLLEIVQAVKSPWVGINLDTGNFRTPDPYGDLAKCAPFAVNVQLKADIHPRGQARQEVDYDRVVQILKEARYQGYVILEYESAADPWMAIPGILKRMQRAFEAGSVRV
jgi:sugar phosphate isomerase/epimerase